VTRAEMKLFKKLKLET